MGNQTSQYKGTSESASMNTVYEGLEPMLKFRDMSTKEPSINKDTFVIKVTGTRLSQIARVINVLLNREVVVSNFAETLYISTISCKNTPVLLIVDGDSPADMPSRVLQGLRIDLVLFVMPFEPPDLDEINKMSNEIRYVYGEKEMLFVITYGNAGIPYNWQQKTQQFIKNNSTSAVVLSDDNSVCVNLQHLHSLSDEERLIVIDSVRRLYAKIRACALSTYRGLEQRYSL